MKRKNETVVCILWEMHAKLPKKMEGFRDGELVVLDIGNLIVRIGNAYVRELKKYNSAMIGVENFLKGLPGKVKEMAVEVIGHEKA